MTHIDDLGAGPKATLRKLNQWAAAIRELQEAEDARPANTPADGGEQHQFVVVENGVAVIYSFVAYYVG